MKDVPQPFVQYAGFVKKPGQNRHARFFADIVAQQGRHNSAHNVFGTKHCSQVLPDGLRPEKGKKGTYVNAIPARLSEGCFAFSLLTSMLAIASGIFSIKAKNGSLRRTFSNAAPVSFC